MTRGALPPEEALRVALEIAQAFEAAHAQGIIHRDLKPANVKLTQDGAVKVLDFGLAKAMSPEVSAQEASPSMSPTTTSVGSVVGMILGTASYMSPEQAKGKAVNRRADIWSFGVVLYELLSGRRLFEGETVSETLAAVLMRDPDWETLPAATQRGARHLLRRCLTRDPKNRLQDIGEARIALEKILAGENDDVRAESVASRNRGILPWLGAGVVLGFALGWLFVSFRGGAEGTADTDDVLRFSVPAFEGVQTILNPEASPDGRNLVYQGHSGGSSKLYLHDFETGHARVVEGTDGGAGPFLSPDGRWVAFHRGTELLKVRLAGGDAVRICDVASDFPGAAWGPDGAILLGALATRERHHAEPEVVDCHLADRADAGVPTAA